MWAGLIQIARMSGRHNLGLATADVKAQTFGLKLDDGLLMQRTGSSIRHALLQLFRQDVSR